MQCVLYQAMEASIALHNELENTPCMRRGKAKIK